MAVFRAVHPVHRHILLPAPCPCHIPVPSVMDLRKYGVGGILECHVLFSCVNGSRCVPCRWHPYSHSKGLLPHFLLPPALDAFNEEYCCTVFFVSPGKFYLIGSCIHKTEARVSEGEGGGDVVGYILIYELALLYAFILSSKAQIQSQGKLFSYVQ